MRNLLMEWLNRHGFSSSKGIKVYTFEMDVSAVGKAKITKKGILRTKTNNVFAFEFKIATTRKLVKEVVEQAILRLVAADYIYIVVPKEAEVWKDEKTKEVINPADLVLREASGTYSRKIGIMTVDPQGGLEIKREAARSGLVVKELRKLVLKKVKQPQKIFFGKI